MGARGLHFRRTSLLSIGLAAFLAGLGFARFQTFPGWPVVVLAIFLSTIAYRNKSLLAAVFILLCGFNLGWARGGAVMNQLSEYQNYYGQKVVVRGVAASDGVYADNSQLEFDLSNLRVIKPTPANLIGTLKIDGFGEKAVYRGDTVQVEGKLFATRGSRQALISFADIKTAGHVLPLIERLRLRFNAGMQNALPEPLGSFGLGLLVGQRSTIPSSINDQLAAVGLTHLIAVSGYNLTIIIRAARRILGNRSKYQTFCVSLLLIGAFILFTGLSASIVRAAIVSTLSLIAWYYGRTIKPLLLILLAATITAGARPLYLWSDIGWYLSFLAFYGILIIAPLVAKRMFNKKPASTLSMLIIESMSAQLMTIPLILYIFAQVSAIGLLSNVLLVPLVPLAMLLSLVAGLAGMLIPAFAGWLAWPARLALTYMLDLVSLLSRVPHALLQRSLRLPAMVFMYALVALVSLVLWHKTRLKNAILTDEETVELEGA